MIMGHGCARHVSWALRAGPHCSRLRGHVGGNGAPGARSCLRLRLWWLRRPGLDWNSLGVGPRSLGVSLTCWAMATVRPWVSGGKAG